MKSFLSILIIIILFVCYSCKSTPDFSGTWTNPDLNNNHSSQSEKPLIVGLILNQNEKYISGIALVESKISSLKSLKVADLKGSELVVQENGMWKYNSSFDVEIDHCKYHFNIHCTLSEKRLWGAYNLIDSCNGTETTEPFSFEPGTVTVNKVQ